MTGTRIAAIRLLCADPAATARFYVETFGAFEEEGEGEVRRLRFGAQRLELAPAAASASALPASNATGFQHCALVVADMEAAMAQLAAAGGWTAISRQGPEHLPPVSGGATAFKFRDPDGHPLELLRFPPDKTPEPWRSASREGSPFLGIDHTAITVADTDRAIAFYAGLGFDVTARQINRGIEQERLDDVTGAVVEVTTLHPAGGAPPHLELLCYREPGTLARPAEDRTPLATETRLSGIEDPVPPADPDGHRLDRASG